MRMMNLTARPIILICGMFFFTLATAQTAPSEREKSSYTGLFSAAAQGDAQEIFNLINAGTPVDARDSNGRTPLHIAAFGSHLEAMRVLVASGADPNALENDRYDIVTIAAVANDLPTLRLSLELGCSAKNVTSRYDGTALIAAAHLGHVEVVQTLIDAGAPLDHVNNLQWTAVIESIVLGDGGSRHTLTLKALVDAGANTSITDGNGQLPIELAQERGFEAMVKILR